MGLYKVRATGLHPHEGAEVLRSCSVHCRVVDPLKENMERYQDPSDPLNAASYHTGKKCVERGCDRSAGTHWSKFWCQPCNAARLGRIGGFLRHEVARHEGMVPPESVYQSSKSES